MCLPEKALPKEHKKSVRVAAKKRIDAIFHYEDSSYTYSHFGSNNNLFGTTGYRQ